jgi:hypothetical protein
MRNMLDADIDSLLQIPVADFLVDDNTDGGFRHVVDHAGLAVVDLVRHLEPRVVRVSFGDWTAVLLMKKLDWYCGVG